VAGSCGELVRITYDPEANAAYIALDGRLVGIEVLAASDLLPAELLEAAERPGRKR